MRIVALLIAWLAWSGADAATTWWVSQSGSGAANGTAQTAAWAGWTGIVQASVVAGDTVCVDGPLTLSASAGWNKTASAGSAITIKGNCPGAAQGKIDGNGITCPTFQIGNSVSSSYIVVDHMEIENCAASSGQGVVMLRSAGGGNHNTIQHSTIRNGGYYCVLTQQGTTTLTDNTIEGCFDDALGGTTASTGFVATLNRISRWSTGTTTGDAAFINNATPGPITLSYNNITWPPGSLSTKQAMILGTSSGTVTVQSNSFFGDSTTTNHAISIESGNADISGNLCLGWRACVTHFSTAGSIVSTMNVRANMAVGSQYVALLSSSTGTPTFNIENNVGSNVVNGLVSTSTVAATVNHYNNSYNVTGTGDALYMGSGGSPAYNGNGNNYYPEYSTFIENYVCGGATYSTLATYKAACAKEAASVSLVHSFAGGVAPRTIQGFRLPAASLFKCAGVNIGRRTDAIGRGFEPNCTPIGAMVYGRGDPRTTALSPRP